MYQILRLEIVPAAVVVQRHWRAFVQRRAYAAIIDATINLQTLIRGAYASYRYQRWKSGAICIQKIWRCFSAQLNYQMALLDIIAVQSRVRKNQAIRYAEMKTIAVGTVQRAARLSLARSTVARKRKELKSSIMIQVSTASTFEFLIASR